MIAESLASRDRPKAVAARRTAVAAPGLAAVHSLTWLVVGNAAGLLLATLLLVPELGRALAPLTYGRWMPVHLDALLYGWCALPLVGLLLRLYAPGRGPEASAPGGGLAVSAWSGALLFGCLSWLGGRSSGKVFVEWTGAARWLFLGALALLAAVLAAGLVRRLPGRRPGAWPGLAGLGALLAVLALVPVGLALGSDPGVYPPINPESGGPTGASLFGSTLGVIWIFAGAPLLLGLERDPEASRGGGTLALLVVYSLAFLALDHGDHSHREAVQIAALASLLVWPPVLARHLRRYRWPAGAGPWLVAFGAWGGLLVLTAVATFLPGVLDRLKFTDALVGHAHLAMAGMLSSFAVLMLLSLTAGTGLAGAVAGRGSCWAWNAGCLLHVLALVGAGALEAADPGLASRGGAALTVLYALRWLAGAAMLAVSVRWLGRALRRLPQGGEAG